MKKFLHKKKNKEKKKKMKRKLEIQESSFSPLGWSVDQVIDWFLKSNLTKDYSSILKENELNGKILIEEINSFDDLQDLGIDTPSDSQKIFEELKNLKKSISTTKREKIEVFDTSSIEEIKKWGVDQVIEWFLKSNLSKDYSSILKENELNGKILIEEINSLDDLQDLGIDTPSDSLEIFSNLKKIKEKAESLPGIDDLRKWGVDQVIEWFLKLSLSKDYSSILKENELNGKILIEEINSLDDLQDLGIDTPSDSLEIFSNLKKIKERKNEKIEIKINPHKKKEIKILETKITPKKAILKVPPKPVKKEKTEEEKEEELDIDMLMDLNEFQDMSDEEINLDSNNSPPLKNDENEKKEILHQAESKNIQTEKNKIENENIFEEKNQTEKIEKENQMIEKNSSSPSPSSNNNPKTPQKQSETPKRKKKPYSISSKYSNGKKQFSTPYKMPGRVKPQSNYNTPKKETIHLFDLDQKSKNKISLLDLKNKYGFRNLSYEEALNYVDEKVLDLNFENSLGNFFFFF